MFKKNYLTILLCLVFKLGLSQTTTNLNVKLRNPVKNATVQSMQNFNLKGTIINLGPDALSASDSLAMYLVVNGDSFNFVNGANFENFKAIGTAGIPVNDSFLINMPFAFSNSFDNQTVNFCLFIKPLNRQTKSIRDSDLSNNSGCATITISPKSSGLNTLTNSNLIALSPNPVSTSFKLHCGFTYNSLCIVDALGRSIALPYNAQHTYDVSILSNGIYTLIASDGLQVAHTQLLIQN